MQEISEEEYLNALNNVKNFKDELFNLRMEHAKCNDFSKQELIEKKIKLLKREHNKMLNTIKIYEFINKGRKI